MPVKASVQLRCLRRAAEICGGLEALRGRLGVTQSELAIWMQGLRIPPTDVFLAAVDIIMAHDPLHGLQHERGKARDEHGEAARLRERYQFLRSGFWRMSDGGTALAAAVDAAVALGAADMGLFQVCDDGSMRLRLVAQQGFDENFIGFFSEDAHPATACAEACRSGARVVVDDVDRSQIFAGGPALELLRAAGVKAVQSTPRRARSGRILGVLSTHYRRPGVPDDGALRGVDVVARRSARWLERRRDALSP